MSLELPNNKKHSLFPDQEMEPEDDDSWQVSYLDIITILLGFLVILLSFSELNDGSSFSVSELFKATQNETEFITTPIEEIKVELENLLAPEIQQGKLEIFRDLNDVRIRFKSDDLYSSGSAQLQTEATQILNRVLAAFKIIKYDDFEIDVEGHTDNVPISSSSFQSNWELSTSRASNIVRYFSKMGLPKERLKASGYADSRPLVKFDEQGNPVPASKDENRRVVLRLYYSSPEKYAASDSLLTSAEIEPESSPSETDQKTIKTESSETATPKEKETISLENKAVATSALEKQPPIKDDPVTAKPQAAQKENAPKKENDLRNGCSYSVQIGSFESFTNSLSVADEGERKTGYKFEITYNNRLFSVRTLGESSFSAAFGIQKDIVSKVTGNNVKGIILQCNTNLSKRPSPIKYHIQLGYFQNEQNAINFKETLALEHNISAEIDQMSFQAFTLLTKPFSDRKSAKRELTSIHKIDELYNAFIKYDPETVSEYSFLYQLQLASFSNKKDVDELAKRIKDEMGLESSIKIYDDKKYYLVTRPFSSLEEVLNLYNIFKQDSSNLSPVVYFIERV